MVKNLLAKA